MVGRLVPRCLGLRAEWVEVQMPGSLTSPLPSQWEGRWRVLPHARLPVWLQDNEFLVHGHRPPLPSVGACLRSVFRLHTETANIWTHLLGQPGRGGAGVTLVWGYSSHPKTAYISTFSCAVILSYSPDSSIPELDASLQPFCSAILTLFYPRAGCILSFSRGCYSLLFHHRVGHISALPWRWYTQSFLCCTI